MRTISLQDNLSHSRSALITSQWYRTPQRRTSLSGLAQYLGHARRRTRARQVRADAPSSRWRLSVDRRTDVIRTKDADCEIKHAVSSLTDPDSRDSRRDVPTSLSPTKMRASATHVSQTARMHPAHRDRTEDVPTFQRSFSAFASPNVRARSCSVIRAHPQLRRHWPSHIAERALR